MSREQLEHLLARVRDELAALEQGGDPAQSRLREWSTISNGRSVTVMVMV